MQIVVARYNEELDWLASFSKYDVVVYNKGHGDFGVKLDNIGREAHTFLYHIVNNYSNLANYICFLQGGPYDHYKNIKDELDIFAGGFKELGGILECDIQGKPHHSLPGLPGAISDLWLPTPARLKFIAGAQFIICKDTLLTRPYNFYEKALHIVSTDPTGAYMMERLWYYIFKGE